MVILEHFLKIIRIYFTLLSWSFFQKNYKKITTILWWSNDFFDTFFNIFVKNNHENGVISILFSKQFLSKVPYNGILFL